MKNQKLLKGLLYLGLSNRWQSGSRICFQVTQKRNGRNSNVFCPNPFQKKRAFGKLNPGSLLNSEGKERKEIEQKRPKRSCMFQERSKTGRRSGHLY